MGGGGGGRLVANPPVPNQKGQGISLWVIPLDLSGVGGHASVSDNTSIALGIIWPHKPHHYIKVEVPLGGHIRIVTDNGVMVLQTCVDLPKLVPGSCSQICEASVCAGNEAVDMKLEEGTYMQEEKDPLLIHEVSCEEVILCVCMPPVCTPPPPPKPIRDGTTSTLVFDSVACAYKRVCCSPQILS
jgi:hypothetical protein